MSRGERRRRREERAAGSPARLRPAVEGLMGAIETGAPYLPDDEVVAAEKVLKKASERLSLAGDHTVVALAGATGSGKSSLFNALVGSEVARVGARRPTTTSTCAAVWGADPATSLLDWLRVGHRHHLAPGRAGRSAATAGLDRLVLLDLPDVDSTHRAHRAEADRVLGMTDVFVWVTDPQKYADALLHDEYLSAARDHAAVTLVVLNQADRMTPEETVACRDDLHRLLALDGLTDAEVLPVSARTGAGLLELTAALENAVLAAGASRARLVGDLRGAARRLREHVADSEPEVPEAPDPDLVDALTRTAGVPVVLRGVEADHRRRALAHTGWPFTRWARGLRADPMKRLHLGREPTPVGGADPERELTWLVARSSLPEPTPAARAGVERLTRRLGHRGAHGLPARWGAAVERAAAPEEGVLADALDRAVLGTPLRRRTSWWWPVIGILQWLLAAAAIVGVLWLLGLGVLSWLQLPEPDPPRWGIVPWPTVLALGGLLLGLLLALLSRSLAAAGARRHRARLERQLRASIEEVARERLVLPVREVIDAHAATRRDLDRVLAD